MPERYKMSRRFLLVVFVVFVLAVAGVMPVAAQDPVAPQISSYGQLPQKGQLIIPFGQQFVAPKNWDTLRVTIWRGMADSDLSGPVKFGQSLAKDRAARYGGTAADYPTVVWSEHPIPGFVNRVSCDTKFGSDAAVLTAGVSYGNAGCMELIEYDQSAVLLSAPAPVVATPMSAAPTQPAPATTATQQPPAVATYTPYPTYTLYPTPQTVGLVAATPTPVVPPAAGSTQGFNPLICLIPLLVGLLLVLVGLVWYFRTHPIEEETVPTAPPPAAPPRPTPALVASPAPPVRPVAPPPPPSPTTP